MLDLAPAALFALFVWWLGTGVVLYLDRLPPRTFRWSLAGAGMVLAASIYGLVATRSGTTPADAYLAFVCAIALWGALEMSYFMGLVSGPRKTPCPSGCVGWQRFRLAIATSLYHELSVVLAAAIVAVLCWDEPNRVGLWTFSVLWLMRWSAKLNVFLGVPNLHGDWLPEHLEFLQSYMGRRPMNHLFPVSVTLGTVIVALLTIRALGADPGSFEAIGLTLVAVLLALAVLEHWFLVLPVPDEALWRWALRQEARPGQVAREVRRGDRLKTEQVAGPA
jgi:putative photosynthetic complex assembly protein 2